MLTQLRARQSLSPLQTRQAFNRWAELTQPEQYQFLVEAQAALKPASPRKLRPRDVSTALFLRLVVPAHVDLDRDDPFNVSPLYEQLFSAERELHLAYQASKAFKTGSEEGPQAHQLAQLRRRFIELRDWKGLISSTYQSRRSDLYGFAFEPLAGCSLFGFIGGSGGAGIIAPPKNLKTGERNSRLYTRTSVRPAVLQQNRYRLHQRDGFHLTHDANQTTYTASVPAVASLEFGGLLGNQVGVGTLFVCPFATDGRSATFEANDAPGVAERRFPATGVHVNLPLGPLFFLTAGFNLAVGGGGLSEKSAQRVHAGVERLERLSALKKAEKYLAEKHAPASLESQEPL